MFEYTTNRFHRPKFHIFATDDARNAGQEELLAVHGGEAGSLAGGGGEEASKPASSFGDTIDILRSQTEERDHDGGCGLAVEAAVSAGRRHGVPVSSRAAACPGLASVQQGAGQPRCTKQGGDGAPPASGRVSIEKLVHDGLVDPVHEKADEGVR